jgi:hypothetical protein
MLSEVVHVGASRTAAHMQQHVIFSAPDTVQPRAHWLPRLVLLESVFQVLSDGVLGDSTARFSTTGRGLKVGAWGWL